MQRKSFHFHFNLYQGRRKHLKNGGARHFEGKFSFRKGAFSKNKKGTSLFIAKPLGHMPPMLPAATSMFFIIFLQKAVFKFY